ncbi:MAG: PD-(D/E)XK nuclease family protein [Alphaproteobacteria bacterium]
MNVSSIPLGVPFLPTLARDLLKQYTPAALAKVLIFLPTRRACWDFRAILIQEAGKRNMLLPRVLPLGELDETEISLSSLDGLKFMADLAPAIPPQKKILILASLIQKFRPMPHREISFQEATSMAYYLSQLIDEFQNEEISLDQIEQLNPSGKSADHWATVLEFLKILSHHWPKILEENKELDPVAKRNKMILFQATEWKKNPPDHPIIIAGSMGTIPTTQSLMKVVAHLPKGQVILPGLQKDLDDAVLPPHHPQFSLYALLCALNIKSTDVKDFMMDQDSVKNRSILFSEIFEENAHKNYGAVTSLLVDNFFYAECQNLQEEVDLISLYIREGLHQKKKVACITDNKILAQRISIELKKWNIQVSPSQKKPFAETLWGSFLRLTSEYFASEFSYLTLLAILKHPLSERFHEDTLKFEKHILRNPRLQDKEPFKTCGISDDFAALIDQLSKNQRVHHSLASYVMAQEHLIVQLLGISTPLDIFLETVPEGPFVQNFWRNLTAYAQSQQIVLDDYASFFQIFIEHLTVTTPSSGDSPFQILTPLEARFITVDRLILASMNEGVWPSIVPPDPFFGMAMRQSIGLPSPEKRKGQSAHDFLQLCNTREILISRSVMAEGSPTLPSPFLTLLLSYLKEKGQKLSSPTTLINWNHQLAQAPKNKSAARRPIPCPPVAARPQSLSVTDIEALIRDPYSIYAKHVLKLQPLKSLTVPTEALDFGVLVHKFMEVWVQNGSYLLPHEAYRLFQTQGPRFFDPIFQSSPYKTFWWSKFKKIIEWVGTLSPDYFGQPIFTEVWGQVDFEGFTLFAKADRIDINAKGALLIDYKTGRPPTDMEMEKRGSVQLPLEAVILKYGHFSKVTKNPTGLSFWDLGTAEGGDIRFYKGDLETLIQETYKGIQELVRLYAQPETPYVALAMPDNYTHSYGHLSRVQEWKRHPRE